MSYDIKRSVSLYSYQDEYYDGKLDLEGCLRETAKTGATGVELLAEQMIRRFPLPIETEEFRAQWFGWLEKYGLEPSCYDAFLENKIYDNRVLSLGEQINMMKRDIRLASMMGFPTLRTLVSTPMDVIEGSLEYAEEKNVKICLEVHAPFSLNSGWADGYMEMIKRTGTKFFGFMPDMGIFCKNIPDVVRDKARRMGASEECIKIVDDAYAQRVAKGFTKIKYDLNLGKANMEYRMANGMKEMMDAENNLSELQKEADDEIESYAQYVCSEEYDNHRIKNIEMWKSMLERETNPTKAARIRKTIYVVENRFTLDFMFERLNNPKTHDKEKSAIIESFFDNNRSNYMMTKFSDKCQQFGLTKNLYTYLLDIEERYLDEKYHVYNNFFLFTALRFISHCGESEINEAKEVIQCMLNLVYNKFYSEDVKEIFLGTIRKFLDQFEDVRDVFDEKNILHPNHPYRIEKQKMREMSLRKKIYDDLEKNAGIVVSEHQEELDALEINELLSYYDEKVKEHKAIIESADDSSEVSKEEENV